MSDESPSSQTPAPKPLRGVQVPPPENDSELPERWTNRKPRIGFFGGLIRVLVLAIVLAALILPFTPYASRVKRGLERLVEKARGEPKVVYRDMPSEVIKEHTVVKDRTVEVKVPVEVRVPVLPPLPSKYVDRKEVDVATLFNNLTIQTTLQTQEGGFASFERDNKDSFLVEFQVKVRVPKPNATLPELTRINQHLPKMLPGLEPMLKDGKVSGFYHKLYERKTTLVQQNLTRLNKILDKHNFFDCETILELTHPESKRKVMLIQSEMDVVTDGSDGDRMPAMSEDVYNSDFYQPFSGYDWAKRGQTPNPLLPRWQSRLDSVKKQISGTSNKQKLASLKGEQGDIETTIRALKTRSSLIAEKDPFIVVSLLFKDYVKTNAFAPAMGDYAAVLYEDKIYPAICGDHGPTMKMGEASLLMAKTINAKATSYSRPVSDLKVTYLIFPGTAEKPFGPPNLERWHEKVSEYLKECGGLGSGYTLHKWENPFPPATPPEPAPPLTPPAPEMKPADPATPAATGSPIVTPPGSPSLPSSTAPGVIPATKTP